MKWNQDDCTLEEFIAHGGIPEPMVMPGNLAFTEINLPSDPAGLRGLIESIDTAVVNPCDIETARALFGMRGRNQQAGGRAA